MATTYNANNTIMHPSGTLPEKFSTFKQKNTTNALNNGYFNSSTSNVRKNIWNGKNKTSNNNNMNSNYAKLEHDSETDGAKCTANNEANKNDVWILRDNFKKANNKIYENHNSFSNLKQNILQNSNQFTEG